MSNHEILVRFEAALDEEVMRKIERRCVERWSLRQMLNVFERGDVTRLEAALTVDILDKGELTDPVSECLRLAIRDKAMALVECGEA